MASRTPREALHHRIRNTVISTLKEYYTLHPKELEKPEADENSKALLRLMEAILRCVDEFEISERPERRRDPSPNGKA